MPNRTIYINKDNWQNFKDYPHKSMLINNMLEHHYKGTVMGGQTQEEVIEEINQEMPPIPLCPKHHMRRVDCVVLHV